MRGWVVVRRGRQDYHLNGDQLFMLEDRVPECLIVPAAPILRPASPISEEEQEAFMKELESFTLE